MAFTSELELNSGPASRNRPAAKAGAGSRPQREEERMARPAVLTVADTIARSFLKSVETRGDRPAIREKKFGIWQPTSWREWLQISKDIAFGLHAIGFQARRRRLDHRQRGAGMGLCRHGHPVRRRRFVRHLSDRLGGAGRISDQRFLDQGDLRRGRGAARQDPVVPRALPDACRRSSCSTWKASAASPIRWCCRWPSSRRSGAITRRATRRCGTR